MFYTSVRKWGNRLLFLGRDDNGRRIKKSIKYVPTIYLPKKSSNETSLKPMKTLAGVEVYPLTFDTIKESKEFIEQYHTMDFPVFGNTKWEYNYIGESFPNDVVWKREHIQVANFDIEVSSERGFPNIDNADDEIIAITLVQNGIGHVFGCGEFNNNDPKKYTYYKCDSEKELLLRFLIIWARNYPDVITGWNISIFDIPYLYNRMRKVLGEETANKLSPWGIVNPKKFTIQGKERSVYQVYGVSEWDYLSLYRKFSPKGQSQESYRLDYIGQEELGLGKLDYHEYRNLWELFEKDYQKFVEYNIRDVEIVDKLDEKLKLIDLALTLAFMSKVNFEDVFHQTRMWDALIFNHLKKKGVVVPQNLGRDEGAYPGAYVKDPVLGLHKWVVGFDLTSLYPSLIIQYGISPDTIINTPPPEMDRENVSISLLLSQETNTSPLKTHNLTMTPNFQFFRRDVEGFLPELMKELMLKRQFYKSKMKDAQKRLEATGKKSIEQEIASYDAMQNAIKVTLNSSYGSIGNPGFRFYDIRQAYAITSAGQLAIQWIFNRINHDLNKMFKTEKVDRVIAGDTDSAYIVLDDFVKMYCDKLDKKETTRKVSDFCNDVMIPLITKHFEALAEYTNATTNAMIMKREAIADKAIWTSKKRYILNVWDSEGVEYAEPKIKITGLEMIKSSTPNASRAKMKEAVKLIINGTEKDIIDFIEDFRKKFASFNIEDVASPRTVNGLKKYAKMDTGEFAKRSPIHVKGSLTYNDAIKMMGLTDKYPTILEGEKIKFIYMKEPNPFGSMVMAFPQNEAPKEFEMEKWVDYELQFNKSFRDPLNIVLSVIGWHCEEVNTLDSYYV